MGLGQSNPLLRHELNPPSHHRFAASPSDTQTSPRLSLLPHICALFSSLPSSFNSSCVVLRHIAQQAQSPCRRFSHDFTGSATFGPISAAIGPNSTKFGRYRYFFLSADSALVLLLDTPITESDSIDACTRALVLEGRIDGPLRAGRYFPLRIPSQPSVTKIG